MRSTAERPTPRESRRLINAARALQGELTDLNARWKAEKAAADRLIGLRRRALRGLVGRAARPKNFRRSKNPRKEAAQQLKTIQERPAPVRRCRPRYGVDGGVGLDRDSTRKLLRDESETLLSPWMPGWPSASGARSMPSTSSPWTSKSSKAGS